MITVVNKKTYKGKGEYIGRPNVLGNPFPVSMGRDKCIAEYKKWLNNKIKSKDSAVCAELNRLYKIAKHGDLTLVCWCAPLACHGDVIKAVIEEKL